VAQIYNQGSLSNQVYSANQLPVSQTANPKSFWGDILKPFSKVALIGWEKIGKTFLCLQLAHCIATGSDFMGMKTSLGSVLYFSFEMDADILDQRLEDICNKLNVPRNQFPLVYFAPGGLPLDTKSGIQEMEDILAEAAKQAGSPIDVVIIDPRQNTIERNEGQSDVMAAWCNNVKELQSGLGFALLVVHHKGKDTSGAGRGSSVFDAWLDSIVWLNPEGSREAPDLTNVKVSVKSRDSLVPEFGVEFDYPTWALKPLEAKIMKDKVSRAEGFITTTLITKPNMEMDLSDLRIESATAGNTPYALNTALDSLETQHSIEREKHPTKGGNSKIVRKL